MKFILIPIVALTQLALRIEFSNISNYPINTNIYAQKKIYIGWGKAIRLGLPFNAGFAEASQCADLNLVHAYLDQGATNIRIDGSQSLTCFVPYRLSYSVKTPSHPNTSYAFSDQGRVAIIRRSPNKQASLIVQTTPEQDQIGTLTAFKDKTYLGIQSGMATAKNENGAIAEVGAGEAVQIDQYGIRFINAEPSCKIEWLGRSRIRVKSSPINQVTIDGQANTGEAFNITGRSKIEVESITGGKLTTYVRLADWLKNKC